MDNVDKDPGGTVSDELKEILSRHPVEWTAEQKAIIKQTLADDMQKVREAMQGIDDPDQVLRD